MADKTYRNMDVDTLMELMGLNDSFDSQGNYKYPNQVCAYCGDGKNHHEAATVPVKKFCARCGCVKYCNRACQKADWKLRHKLECDDLRSQTKASRKAEKNRTVKALKQHQKITPDIPVGSKKVEVDLQKNVVKTTYRMLNHKGKAIKVKTAYSSLV
jgi:hypothetical protein